MTFELPSFAKINLGLRVLGKRADGYHELCTVFQTVSLHDTLTFAFGDKLVLQCEMVGIPTDESNLIIKAVRGLEEVVGRALPASITLEKRIPSPGELGGGSSNAAVALIGVCRLFGLEIANEDDVLSLARSLGADVPYFLIGGTAIGTGRGDKIEPVAEIDEREMLIVTPPVDIATGSIFAALNADSLTSETAESIISVCRERALDDIRTRAVLINDLEQVVCSSYPEVRKVKDTLIGLGAISAAMSGSGASVFAVFDKKETRQAAEKALDTESTWRKFAVSTISRSQNREAPGLA